MQCFWEQGGSFLIHAAMGIGLAACAGLRTFLPLFIVGLAGRGELVQLSESMHWLASWPALVVFGTAVIVELGADKVPLVDHALDAVQVFVKPIVGALLVTTVVEGWTPLYVTLAGIVVGGSTAGVVHLAKSKLRLLSSFTTAGWGNPVLSLVEDIGALAGTVAAILVPVVLLVVLVSAGVLGGLALARLRRRAAAPATSRGQSSP